MIKRTMWIFRTMSCLLDHLILKEFVSDILDILQIQYNQTIRVLI